MNRQGEASLLCFQIEHAVAFNLHDDHQYLSAAKHVLERGAALHYAAEYGGRNALMLAVSKGFEGLVRFFLQDMQVDVEGRDIVSMPILLSLLPLMRYPCLHIVNRMVVQHCTSQ